MAECAQSVPVEGRAAAASKLGAGGYAGSGATVRIGMCCAAAAMARGAATTGATWAAEGRMSRRDDEREEPCARLLVHSPSIARQPPLTSPRPPLPLPLWGAALPASLAARATAVALLDVVRAAVFTAEVIAETSEELLVAARVLAS